MYVCVSCYMKFCDEKSGVDDYSKGTVHADQAYNLCMYVNMMLTICFYLEAPFKNTTF